MKSFGSRLFTVDTKWRWIMITIFGVWRASCFWLSGVRLFRHWALRVGRWYARAFNVHGRWHSVFRRLDTNGRYSRRRHFKYLWVSLPWFPTDMSRIYNKRAHSLRHHWRPSNENWRRQLLLLLSKRRFQQLLSKKVFRHSLHANKEFTSLHKSFWTAGNFSTLKSRQVFA